jgi:hypothetical protein
MTTVELNPHQQAMHHAQLAAQRRDSADAIAASAPDTTKLTPEFARHAEQLVSDGVDLLHREAEHHDRAAEAARDLGAGDEESGQRIAALD